jgi:hypothetical protein
VTIVDSYAMRVKTPEIEPETMSPRDCTMVSVKSSLSVVTTGQEINGAGLSMRASPRRHVSARYPREERESLDVTRLARSR